MADSDKSDVPMLSKNDPPFSPFERNVIWTRSASMSMFMNSKDSYENETSFNVSHTGPLRSQRSSFIPMSGPLYVNNNLHCSLQGQDVTGKNEAIEKNSSIKEVNQDEWADDFSSKNQHLLRSGQLGICNDPYCTTCPTYYHFKGAPHKHSKASAIFDRQLHNALYGDAKGWVARFFSFIGSYIPGVMNPHAKVVQQWNQFFVISCLVAIFVDPLFFFLLSVQENNKCILLNSPMTTTIVVLRSLTDFIYSLHILLQFRLAYVAPETTVVGAGDLVDHPKKVAINYLRGYFLIDFFIVLPLPQIIILLILPVSLGSGANYAKNLLRAAVLVQYIPRLYRFLPMLAGQSPSGFIFESAWANFIINLLTFVLAGHVVGSCWYLFGLQRVNQCLRNACHNSKLNMCMEFIDCGHGNKIHEFMQHPNWSSWTKNVNATACFSENGFSYGIYVPAVNLTTRQSIITRYVYSLFWGFQQISTLAGNQSPSYFVWEVLFTMAIIGLGLLLFALLIGNMQNFLQGLEKRRLEMSLRRRDVEQWMSHRRLPKELRRQVRQAERYNWAATRGVNEEMLLENLPEDLQRDIRRHLFKFIKKVRIFSLMDDPILDAICERLRQKTYIKGNKIFCTGGLMDKMVFVVRGKLESTGVDGIKVPLKEEDACGEELLTWCLEHSSVYKNGKRIRIPGLGLLSSRTVRCLTNVEAFSLRAVDLEEVTGLFSRFLRNPRVQGAIRYESHYWRGLAATHIQVAWRYRKKRLKSYCSNTHSS